jgi:large subunit ribosomal protein L20
MTRATAGKTTHQRRKKVFKQTKGFRGRANNCFSMAIQRLEKSLVYAYRDRRNRKRDFRGLWIQRINAAVREHGLTYSVFMGRLIAANISIDRKMLADIAVRSPEDFAMIVAKVK